MNAEQRSTFEVALIAVLNDLRPGLIWRVTWPDERSQLNAPSPPGQIVRRLPTPEHHGPLTDRHVPPAA